MSGMKNKSAACRREDVGAPWLAADLRRMLPVMEMIVGTAIVRITLVTGAVVRNV